MGERTKTFLELVGGSGLIVAVTCLCVVLTASRELAELLSEQSQSEPDSFGFRIIWSYGQAAVTVAFLGLALTITSCVVLIAIELRRRALLRRRSPGDESTSIADP